MRMTAPYFDDGTVTLHLGDCLDVLRTLPDASVDAVVTDPPYELGFMGRSWDASGIAFNPAAWAECLRVLKPGGHLLAFGGTRTYHRLAVAIEDSGFDIRDSIGCASGVIAWCYGSGFPKSRNISEDPSFCQCVPPVRGTAAEEAAESAAHLLLADLRRNGQALGTDITDLHGLPVDLHPDYALPGRAQQDVRPGVCGDSHITKQEGPALAERSEGQGPVRPVRGGRHEVAKQAQAQRPDILFDQLPGASECGDAACECIRRNGDNGHTPLRGGQPSLEGRGDLQALEGQLHRAQVCPLSARPDDDGPIGRLHHGAPSRDGSLDRTSAAAHGSRESHRSKSTQQRQGEPGTVSLKRGSQARRGWPLCGGCGKPALPAGLGTALKPAWEPIVVARKPLAVTVAQTVLEHGTGALNIDACRTAVSDRAAYEHNGNKSRFGDRRNEVYGVHQDRADSANGLGRWPTNVVFSHPPKIVDGEVVGDACADGCVEGCPVRELDAQSGIRPSGGLPGGTASNTGLRGNTFTRQRPERPSDNGGASRYFPQFRYSAHDRQFSLVKCPTCGDALTGDASTPVGRKTESSGDNWPTDGSGSKLTDQSPRGTRSTTETTTPSTTSCPTSCASPPSGTTITINDSAKTTNGSTVSSTDGASDATSTSRSAASTSGERGHSTGTAENAPRHTGASGSHETATSSTLSVEPSGPLATTRSHPPFRYVAKAPASERPKLPDGTAHNTVKPLDLVRWLVRLVTPPGGTVLDPFAGSGTTGEAAVIEGFRAVLIEREAPYAELIKARLAKPISPVLDFGEEIA